MNRVSGIVRTHLTDYLSWTLLPWIIMGFSFVINLIIGSLVDEEVKSGGLGSLFIYMMVLGIVSIAQTFPFLVSFGARRKDYFLGTAATIAFVSAGSAIVLILIGYLERATNHWGMDLYFFNFFSLTDGPVLERFWFFFAGMIHLYYLGFAIGAVYRRFGRNGLFGFFIAVGLAFTCAFYLIGYYGKWQSIWNWVSGISVFELANGLVASMLIYVAASYLMLRKSTV